MPRHNQRRGISDIYIIAYGILWSRNQDIMNDVELYIFWNEISRTECINCKVLCQIKKLNGREIIKKRKEGAFPLKFKYVEKYKSCIERKL